LFFSDILSNEDMSAKLILTISGNIYLDSLSFIITLSMFCRSWGEEEFCCMPIRDILVKLVEELREEVIEFLDLEFLM
jgi:hypothetical protein